MEFFITPFKNTELNFFHARQDFIFLQDVIVDFDTSLVYKDGSIIWDCAAENILWDPAWITSDIRWGNKLFRQQLVLERMKALQDRFENKIQAQESIETIGGVSLHLLHPFGRYVFGHLFDSLQKIFVAEKHCHQYDTVLLSDPREILNIEEHLKILDLDKKKCIYKSGLAKIESLIYISPPAYPTTFIPESYNFIRSKYLNYYGLDGSVTPNKKIFLTRRKGNFGRYLANDQMMEAELKKQDILYLDGKQSFQEIIAAFSMASHVAGVHGSLFTNNIFGNIKTKYLEYCPNLREVHTFHHQFKLCENYKHNLVECDEGFNISIDPVDVLNFYQS